MKKIFFSLILVFSSFISFSQEKGLDQKIDEAFAPISDFFSQVVFFQVGGYPFEILLLLGSAAFFTYILDFLTLSIFLLQLML